MEPYTEEDMLEMRDESYEKGYNKGMTVGMWSIVGGLMILYALKLLCSI